MEKNYTVGNDISRDLGYNPEARRSQNLGSRRIYVPESINENYNTVVLGNQKVSPRYGKTTGLMGALTLGVAVAGIILGAYSNARRDESSNYSDLEKFIKSHSSHVSYANPEVETPFTAYVQKDKLSYLANELSTKIANGISYNPDNNTILVDVNKDGKMDYRDLAILGHN